MDVLTVNFFNEATAARDVLLSWFVFSAAIQKDRLREDVVKAAQTLRDIRKYVLENLTAVSPSDRFTSIKYDEVTVRRLAHVKKTFEAVAHATGNFERVSKSQEYAEAQSVINSFARHIKEQIKKAGG